MALLNNQTLVLFHKYNENLLARQYNEQRLNNSLN